jgi:hypothetical protein
LNNNGASGKIYSKSQSWRGSQDLDLTLPKKILNCSAVTATKTSMVKSSAAFHKLSQ